MMDKNLTNMYSDTCADHISPWGEKKKNLIYFAFLESVKKEKNGENSLCVHVCVHMCM